VDDLASEVFLALIDDDFATLRHFREESSLATYLTVVARRVVVRELLRRRRITSLQSVANRASQADQGPSVEERLSDREQIERLLQALDSPEAEVVRMYHLEGKSYQEISSQVGMPENSVGPTLSRARAKMRRAGRD
jgi:RNA polymerase sigma-70 factor (ECF subfamily)